MSNGQNVFATEMKVRLEHMKEVVERRLDPKLIKEREQSGTKLSYIGGHTVIRLLNEAFNYQWSYEIVSEEIIESQPKPMTEWKDRKKVPVRNADGSQKMEPQPPVAKVLGRLTVPGFGVKEQYGSKVIIGGATEQEASFKSASTDALKKCATLFGIGLELYEDDDESTATTSSQPASTPANNNYNKAPVPAAPTANWKQEDINRLKELKSILGITDNAQLDPYVREFMDDVNATNKLIQPANIAAFNIFLGKKAETV